MGGPGIKGSWQERRGAPPRVSAAWEELEPRFRAILARHPGIKASPARTRLGTLGGGNHFIGVCLDPEDAVWLMLHSGSRGVGNRIGSYFIARAREHAHAARRRLSDEHLAWLDEDTPLFRDYVEAVGWAQDYARTNRRLMLDALAASVRAVLGRDFEPTQGVVDCPHNYIQPLGGGRYLTRKGAVSARAGEPGIIPGSMGARSFIVRGSAMLRPTSRACTARAGA